MTDQGNEIARYEKSTISMTHMSHDPSAVRFTSGGTERVISGGMILIDNIETSVVHTDISHTDAHKMSGDCSPYDVMDFICEDIGIPGTMDIMNDNLNDIYSKSNRKLDMNKFIRKFNRRFMITQIDYNHIPLSSSTIYDLHEIIKYHHMFVQR